MKTLLSTLLLLTLTVAVFAEKKEKVHYGRNIISFIPVYAIADNNIGVGGSYEILANDYLGVRIPVMAGINSSYFNTGIELKVYPGKNTGPAKYAIAPMIMFGTGTQKENSNTYWDPNLNQYVTQTSEYERSHFGFLLNQTVNFTMMQNFYIGIDGGIGINYYDNRRTSLNYYPYNTYSTNDISFLGQFHVMLGVRF